MSHLHAAEIEFLTPEEMAERLKVSVDTIIRMCERDEIPHIVLGSGSRKIRRIPIGPLAEWIAKNVKGARRIPA